MATTLIEWIQENPQWFFFLAGIVVTIVVGLVVERSGFYWNRKENRRLARETGAFDKPELEVSLVFPPLTDACQLQPNSAMWYLVHPGIADDIMFVFLPIVIKNHGAAPCEDLLVTVSAPIDIMGKSLFEGLSFEAGGWPFPEQVKSAVHEVGKWATVSQALPTIRPGMVLRTFVPLRLISTMGRPLKTKVNMVALGQLVPVAVELSFDYSRYLALTVQGLNTQPIRHTIPLSIIQATTMSEAAEQVTHRLLEQAKRTQPQNLWQKAIYRMRFRHAMRRYHVVQFRTERVINGKQSRIHFMETPTLQETIKLERLVVNGTMSYDLRESEVPAILCIVSYEDEPRWPALERLVKSDTEPTES